MEFKVLCIAALAVSAAFVVGCTSTNEKKAETPAKPVEKIASVVQPNTILIKPEVDKTDIFAIPEDTSEEEEREDAKALEKLQQYEQNKREEKAMNQSAE